MLDGHIAPELGDHVSEAFRPKFDAKTSRPGDVIVTTKGTVGRVAQIGPDDPEFVYAPQLCFFRTTGNGLNSRYLYYWFRSREFRDQATALKSQTDMADYINLADIRGLRLTLPTPASQRAVADVLGVLDDKIEANRRLVKTADALITTELDIAPTENWPTEAVSSLARFVNGGAFTKGASGKGRMVLRIAELNSGPGGSDGVQRARRYSGGQVGVPG